jgi:integrase/recombinase XerD
MGRTRQSADRVNIIKQIKVGKRWPFATLVEKNGRVVRDHVWVAGTDEHHPEGRYYMEWYQNGRRRRQSVPDFSAVTNAARRKWIELQALGAGIVKLDDPAPPSEESGRLTLAEGLERYLGFVESQRAKRTFLTYRFTLGTLLCTSYRKTYIDQVDREDILRFISDCYKRRLGGRTVYDKVVVVTQFFKHYGKTRLLQSSDWPEYVETIRPIYEPEEIAALFRAAKWSEAGFFRVSARIRIS